MTRPQIAWLIGALTLAAGPAPAQGGGRTAGPQAPLASPERTDRPRPAAEWKDGANLVRAFVSSERSAYPTSFGEWFGVESTPPPDGWVLRSATFHLVGDRFCAGSDASPKGAGISAECRQDMRSDRAVRWAFRVEGRDPAEEANPWKLALGAGPGQIVASGAAHTSRGIVICTYGPAGAPAPPGSK